MLAHEGRASDGESAAHHHGGIQHIDADVVRGECLGPVVVADEGHEQEEAKLQDQLLQGNRVADVQQPLVARLVENVAGIELDGQFLAHPQRHQNRTAQDER